jgi:pimeloyl-ACP methyl ester carboxylesterase
MSVQGMPLKPPSRALMLFEGRAIYEFGAFLAAMPLLSMAPRGDGHPVIVFPGFVTSDRATLLLRRFLRRRGYAVSGWGLGRNLGPHAGIERSMLDLVCELNEKHHRKVSLVGWSLGGLYARQLAKLLPGRVRSVITLGSPFACGPKSTNAWRLYEIVSGQSVDEPDLLFGGPISETPPVPTTAIFSRTDGIVAWQGCVEQRSVSVENIEVLGSHTGLTHHPAVAYAVADRLAQCEGEWKPFHRNGWRSIVFPNPDR